MPDKLGDRARLMHIIDSIETIESYVGDSEYENFENNSMMKDACVRQLGIIGEASNRISEEIKGANQEIEWRQIIGLRNIVIHQYFGMDDQVIWDIIQHNLPNLKSRIISIVNSLGD